MNKSLIGRWVAAGAFGVAALGLTAAPSEAVPPNGAVLSAQQAKLLANDAGLGDEFGYSVAISGDSAIVGAIGDDGTVAADQGAAYVFTRAGTSWTQQAKLVPNDPQARDWYGVSVAIAGDTAVVGAHIHGGTNQAEGAAYVFTRTGSTWAQQAKLVATDPALSDRFGYSVAIAGDTVLVGALQDAGPMAPGQGSTYVFTRSGTTWTKQTVLLPTDAAAHDAFGVSVAIAGDTAVVGAFLDDGTLGRDEGSAYVFTRSGTTWTQQMKLLPSDPAVTGRFGTSVAIAGETVVVGAVFEDGYSWGDPGSAYVFTRSGGAWTQQTKLLPSDPAALNDFGGSVAIAGDTAVIGAYLDNGPGGLAETGSAYVFTRSGTTWTPQTKLFANDAATSDHFGRSVGIAGDTAVIGAHFDDGTAGAEQGSAYIFVPGAFSVSDATVQEGSGGGANGMTFVVTRTGTLANAAYVDVATVAGAAQSDVDFDATSTTLTFNPGVASQPFTVPIVTDSLDEPNETFGVALSSPSGALIRDGWGKGTINDDDVSSTLSIAAANPVTESDDTQVPATFTVTRGGSSGGPVSVAVQTVDGAAKAPDDYDPHSATMRWADGETGAKTFTVMVEPDNLTEPVERFYARLSNAVGADIVTGTARATINDDDVAAGPSLAVNDPTVLEANSSTKNIFFKVTRTGSTANAITFNFATANGTAVAPGDYTAKTGTATIAAGATFVNVAVVTKGDVTVEPHETFSLTISNPTGGATVSKATGTGTISNND